MRIVVVSTPVFAVPCSGYSGLEVIAWQLAKGLAAKGHQVILLAPEGSSCPGVSVVTGGCPPGNWDERTLYDKTWQVYLQAEVVIDHSWTKHAYLLKAEGRLTVPVLGVCHAPVDTMYKALPPVPKPCMVCISQDQAKHFEALHNRPAHVAYNGCDLKQYKALGIPRTDRFLFLARFSTIKGPDLAIEACLKAGVGLDLIGDISITSEPELLNRCKAMCDGKQIKLIGPVSRAETIYWFSQAHCLLHPNKRFREPFGLAPVESMLCGCPVIAWDYGAMRETIDYGHTGMLVKSEEELVAAIKVWGPDTPPLNREPCRKWASKFSVENMVNRYEQLAVEAIRTGGW